MTDKERETKLARINELKDRIFDIEIGTDYLSHDQYMHIHELYAEMHGLEKELKDNKDMMIELYKQYIDYHTRFNRGDERIYQQMMAVDELLDGELMKEDMFDAIKKKAEEEICGTTQ